MIGTTLRNTALAALACMLIAVSALNGTQFSSAMYTAQSSNVSSTASSAADWTPPTVDVVDPGTALKGSVTITANAADAETGVASVMLQMQATGAGTWTTLCTSTAAPYRCTWNTTAVTDGSYDLRAVAVDRAGYSTTSATVRTTVSNAFGVTLADPGEVLRGTVPQPSAGAPRPHPRAESSVSRRSMPASAQRRRRPPRSWTCCCTTRSLTVVAR